MKCRTALNAEVVHLVSSSGRWGPSPIMCTSTSPVTFVSPGAAYLHKRMVRGEVPWPVETFAIDSVLRDVDATHRFRGPAGSLQRGRYSPRGACGICSLGKSRPDDYRRAVTRDEDAVTRLVSAQRPSHLIARSPIRFMHEHDVVVVPSQLGFPEGLPMTIYDTYSPAARLWRRTIRCFGPRSKTRKRRWFSRRRMKSRWPNAWNAGTPDVRRLALCEAAASAEAWERLQIPFKWSVLRRPGCAAPWLTMSGCKNIR